MKIYFFKYSSAPTETPDPEFQADSFKTAAFTSSWQLLESRENQNSIGVSPAYFLIKIKSDANGTLIFTNFLVDSQGPQKKSFRLIAAKLPVLENDRIIFNVLGLRIFHYIRRKNSQWKLKVMEIENLFFQIF